MAFWQRWQVGLRVIARGLSADPRSATERAAAMLGPDPGSVSPLREEAGRCIQCGLCDAFAEDPDALAPSRLPLWSSRPPPGAPPRIPAEERLGRAEAVCPTRVPLRRLAGALRAQHEAKA